jgi:hypothetical protein
MLGLKTATSPAVSVASLLIQTEFSTILSLAADLYARPKR